MLQLRSQRGFTLVELMVGVSILSALMFLGIPAMTQWMVTNKARLTSEFYADGLSTARRQAVVHNARTRFTVSNNATNGQMDWQIDICFPTATTPCNSNSGVWSTTATAAPGDPLGAAGFKSVFRSADRLVQSNIMAPSVQPSDATAVYFTEVGWVDTNSNPRLTRLQFDPAAKYKGEVPAVALVITLAGLASKCDPTKNGTDSRACPP
ncbi:pilus assembly FimT family protein [Pseudoduganella sp. RAF53_2]|uniref:pilus assembly FimT family protein n=1 Tax=unclassified Pseudoduganella TaxID=2637179 RepID=UPI003F95443D